MFSSNHWANYHKHVVRSCQKITKAAIQKGSTPQEVLDLLMKIISSKTGLV